MDHDSCFLRPISKILFLFFLVSIIGVSPVSAGGKDTDLSPQAREFLLKYRAGPLNGPLTAGSAKRYRADIQKASAGLIKKLRTSLISSVEERQIAGVKVLVFTPRNHSAQNDDKIAIYLHGGGYVFHSAECSAAILMASDLGLRVYSIDYSLAPEHPFPDGLEDCIAVYRKLIKEFAPKNIAVTGGSAGGGLAMAMLLKAHDLGLPLPAVAGLFSPWSDLTRTGDSYYANEGRDPVIRWDRNIEYLAAAYAGANDPRLPLISPVYGVYTKEFPPTIIITGTRDLFLSNSVRLSRVMKRAGVRVELDVFEGMWHGFTLMPGLPEGREARRVLADYVMKELGR